MLAVPMGMLPALRSASARLVTVVLLFGLLMPSVAGAQSAADKATARRLATEAVKLYNDGNHAEALDRMQRAQKLYDAPVHLLYIARAQVKLGQIVEGAETYRRLSRVSLGDGAPKVFQDAVETAKTELPPVEKQIASLKIDVQPADAEGLELLIDEKPVSAAVLGVERPTNPGDHQIVVRAPGYREASQQITLAPGEEKALAIQLEADPSAPPPKKSEGAKGNGDEGGAGPEEEPSQFGFVVGARLLGLVPNGELVKGEKITDSYGSGGGLELRGGVRFAQLFTGHLFFAGFGVQSGDKFDEPPIKPSDTESQTLVQQFGIGVAVGTPPGSLGGFGQLDFLILHRFETTRDIKADPLSCNETLVAQGPGLRLLGGMVIPISPRWQVTPVAGASFGTITSTEASGCDELAADPNSTLGKRESRDVPDDLRATHSLIHLGVGIDWLLGSDIVAK